MKFFSNFLFLAVLVFASNTALQAQIVPNDNLIVVNGGQYGATNSTGYANIGVFSFFDNTFTSIDTIGSTSVQDILLEGTNNVIGQNSTHFAYVAAADSIIKYDLVSQKRTAAAKFGAVSTVKLGLYQDKLLVGNWYAPFGQPGPYTNHFRIFDTDSLTYVDSIPQIDKPATDFVVIDDFAYIVQNHIRSVGFGDTLGYLAVVDLTTMTWVRNDTIANNGEEMGRLLVEDSIIYVLNPTSNTISTYNINTQVGSTQAAVAGVDLRPTSYAATAFLSSTPGVWYFPFDSGIGSYDLVNNTIVDPSIIMETRSFAFTYSPLVDNFYVSTIDFVDQTKNTGTIYNLTGDSTDSFPVGLSPEVLATYRHTFTAINKLQKQPLLSYEIYPNPTQQQLTIELTKEEMVQVGVYTTVGQLVQTKTLQAQTLTMNVEKLVAGTYFVRVTNAKGETQTKRFTKL